MYGCEIDETDDAKLARVARAAEEYVAAHADAVAELVLLLNDDGGESGGEVGGGSADEGDGADIDDGGDGQGGDDVLDACNGERDNEVYAQVSDGAINGVGSGDEAIAPGVQGVDAAAAWAADSTAAVHDARVRSAESLGGVVGGWANERIECGVAEGSTATAGGDMDARMNKLERKLDMVLAALVGQSGSGGSGGGEDRRVVAFAGAVAGGAGDGGADGRAAGGGARGDEVV